MCRSVRGRKAGLCGEAVQTGTLWLRLGLRCGHCSHLQVLDDEEEEPEPESTHGLEENAPQPAASEAKPVA